MEWKTRIRDGLRVDEQPPDDDVVEELAQHARAMYERARAEGYSADEAEREVTGQIDQWRAEARALRRRPRRPPAVQPSVLTASWIPGLASDIQYACRLLRRRPGFALLVILTMGLGIGATSTLFSTAYGVLMKPMPWPDAERLVVLTETRGSRSPRFGSFSNAAYLAWREQASTVDGIAAWMPQTFTMTGVGDPDRVRVTLATASLFRLLGVRPLVGSLFADENARVVVLSEGLWQQRFGRDPNVPGRIVYFDGEPHTVIGVTADALAFPDRQMRAWVPFRVPAAAGNHLAMFEAVAKLRPDATPQQAAAEGTARGRLAANTGMTTMAIFGGDGPVEVSARPLREVVTGDVRRPLIALLAAIALLLLIATANIAGLQLARTTTRRRELAIRAALGAAAGRTIRQLFVESLILALTGGAAGLVVAWLLHRSAGALLPADFPQLHELSLDYRVVLFALGTTLTSSIIFGLLPAIHVRRLNLVDALSQDGISPVGFGARSPVARHRLLIAGGQVAVACVLLVGALLLGRSFVHLLRADRGFDPSRVLSAALPMPSPGYTPARRTALLAEVISELEAAPGVRRAAFTSENPLTPGGSTSSFTLPSNDPRAGTVVAQASPRLVSPGYFATLGLRVVRGRPLEESDTATSPGVVVVNETFARRYLGDDPIGARIPMGVWGGAERGEASVVGVVQDVRYVRAAVTTLPEMYFSYRQISVGMRSTIATLLVRGDDSAIAFAPIVRTAIRRADRTLVPASVMTLEDRLLATSLARPRLYAGLLGSFAVAAVGVTALGLFGVLSYSVAQRTRELGVRAALGARRRDLIALVVRQGIGVVAAGIVVGLIASLWAMGFVATLLYGVTPRDPATYVAVAAVLLAVAAAACFAPARRVARLDPLRALRS